MKNKEYFGFILMFVGFVFLLVSAVIIGNPSMINSTTDTKYVPCYDSRDHIIQDVWCIEKDNQLSETQGSMLSLAIIASFFLMLWGAILVLTSLYND